MALDVEGCPASVVDTPQAPSVNIDTDGIKHQPWAVVEVQQAMAPQGQPRRR
jgi:hypothetical protein